MTEIQLTRKIRWLLQKVLDLDPEGKYIRPGYRVHIMNAMKSLETREQKGLFDK